MNPRLDIDRIIDDRRTRIIVCCGSGGVGKTTTAAALGLRAAERGRQVCVLTVDPALRLAQSMGLTSLDNTPRLVDGIDDEAGGSLHAYACDFPSRKLQGHARVITTPHLGASTSEAEDNCAVMVADQLREFLEAGNVRNSVNFPEAVLPLLPGKQRLTIVNANVPNMVGQITTALAQRQINISDLLNKSRGELAYTLVDVDQAIPAELVAEISRIKGVLNTRVIAP